MCDYDKTNETIGSNGEICVFGFFFGNGESLFLGNSIKNTIESELVNFDSIQLHAHTINAMISTVDMSVISKAHNIDISFVVNFEMLRPIFSCNY